MAETLHSGPFGCRVEKELMTYHNPHKKNGTITTKVVCAVCFITFSFVWLYWFQADVLAVAQHVLSGGKTHYDRLLGAIIITVALFLVHLGVFAVTRLSRRTHALTYLPSMLMLAILSDNDIVANGTLSFGLRFWLVPLILALWVGAVWLAKQVLPFESDDKVPNGLFSRRVWQNLLQMAVMMLFVAVAGNSKAVFHFRAHAEIALMRGDVDEVLRVGHQSLESDEALTMLRVHALARKGKLGERLFEYPIVGNSETLLPTCPCSSLLILPADTIWKSLGARPAFRMPAHRYYYCLEHDSLATPLVKDYVLCSHLIDRDLDAFVAVLPKYYEIDASLPRYYREALVLYQHTHAQPALIYHDPAIEEVWNDMRELEDAYSDPDERRLRVFEKYRDSYWFYYFYKP